MALELVSGADFWCKLMYRGSPGDLGGSRGRFPAQNPGKPARQFLARLPSGTQALAPLSNRSRFARYWRLRCRVPPLGWPYSRMRQPSGYLKAAWLKKIGPVFLCFRPKIDPGTPLDRRGLPGTSICTKNQPRRPILRPFRGTQKLQPDCLYPAFRGMRSSIVCGPKALVS